MNYKKQNTKKEDMQNYPKLKSYKQNNCELNNNPSVEIYSIKNQMSNNHSLKKNLSVEYYLNNILKI